MPLLGAASGARKSRNDVLFLKGSIFLRGTAVSNSVVSNFVELGSAGLRSVLEAIKEGEWSYEPECVDEECFQSTSAIPGSIEKLSVMAARIEAGLPLWHGHDKMHYNDLD